MRRKTGAGAVQTVTVKTKTATTTALSATIKKDRRETICSVIPVEVN
jgi:hypothetical protein